MVVVKYQEFLLTSHRSKTLPPHNGYRWLTGSSIRSVFWMHWQQLFSSLGRRRWELGILRCLVSLLSRLVPGIFFQLYPWFYLPIHRQFNWQIKSYFSPIYFRILQPCRTGNRTCRQVSWPSQLIPLRELWI